MLGHLDRLASIQQRHANRANLSPEELRVLKKDVSALRADLQETKEITESALSEISEVHLPRLETAVSEFESSMKKLNDEEDERLEFVTTWVAQKLNADPSQEARIGNDFCDLMRKSAYPEVLTTVVEIVQSWEDLEMDALVSKYYSGEASLDAVAQFVIEKARSRPTAKIVELFAYASLEDKELLDYLK